MKCKICGNEKISVVYNGKIRDGMLEHYTDSDVEIYKEVEENFKERMYKDVQAQDKEVRDANIEKITEDINNYFLEKYGEEKVEEIAADIAGSSAAEEVQMEEANEGEMHSD